MVCKLDIENACDNVNWKFLLSVLEKMGFSPKWRRWILFCFSTIKLVVLVSGTPTNFFSTYWGLRQGDPFSPYLFVLIMEAFNRLIAKVEEGVFIKGVKIEGRGGEGVQVSHLLFADDTLLFYEDDEDQLKYWKWIVTCFKLVSG